MALNPFEQLRLVTVEPRTAFEEIVGILLLDHGKSDGQVKVHFGDGGIDAYQGTFGDGGELIVYQSKYFPDPWQDSQKRQIRESFQTANESNLFKLKEWFLCVPTRPTKEDLRWFDEWKNKQSLKQIDLVDGDDLTRLLEAPQGSRARLKLGQWGVFSIRDGYAVLEFSTVCIAQHPRSGFTFRLDVWLTNKGDRTAEGLKVMAQHSDTNCVGIQSDRSQWDNPASAVQNPRTLWSKSDLHPGEHRLVMQIPLVQHTPFPFWIKAAAWFRDNPPTEQVVSIEDTVLSKNAIFVFDSGNTESNTRTASIDGGYRSKPLPTNFSEDADNIFMEIVDNPDPSQFGVLCYREGDLADSKQGLYRPSLSPSGLNHQMDKMRLQLALEELVDKGWLYPAERAGAIDLYRLSDNARENEIFIHNVNEVAKRRQYL